MEIKFNIGDQVKIKDTDKVGIVKAYKIDGYSLYDINHVVIKYCVQVGVSYYQDWYQQEKLEHYSSYEFDNEFELSLIDLLIDIYLLDKKNIPLVEKLHNSKKLYVR